MFSLVEGPIDYKDKKNELRDTACGGFVSFEGWVRDFNEGKEVECLEYESYEALARKEAELIINEAKNKFEIRKAICIHRVGRLNIEDMAVWIGVTGIHRGEAFKGCEYIINQLKIRVPVWKKEHYKDGTSIWVACHECKKHEHA